ncbi:hypothetical protein [Chryseobacterium flavum]|uniref:hypothetical protein n=1 Tax=Chryseobacterium flavum TaxID=415851 RepID=UPI0028AD1494|nr:hypothetical protein [Chryseobacterium flavum]
MKNTILILIAGFTMFVSCKENKDNGLTRTVFDPGNLKFISTSLNPGKKTMSALYGNDQAFRSLSETASQPEAGSIMKLVTWRYHDNPQYTGGTITGELVSIETVKTDHLGTVSYKNQSTDKNNQSEKERIQYFMSYKPVSRP